MAGHNITITLACGTVQSLSPTKGIEIPSIDEVVAISVPKKCKAIVVVEKDTIFNKLCRERVATTELLAGELLLLTVTFPFSILGKGYGDLRVRNFIALLVKLRRIPVYLMVDGDPDGADIGRLYKESLMAAIPEGFDIRLIGLLPSDLKMYRTSQKHIHPLTPRERKKCQDMLARTFNPFPPEWRYILEDYLKNGVTAGLNAVQHMKTRYFVPTFMLNLQLLKTQPRIIDEWLRVEEHSPTAAYLITKLSKLLPLSP
ncbi:DNA topoisomerase IV, alpha subunit [Clavulina sp. PMI_390]|nr:DNA topoisomerase IV, alpha subunit [Clavulina sp. PMI_390]